MYNGKKDVAEAIRSVLKQTYTDFHLIVVDDGSTDRSGAIIGAFSDSRLRVIRRPINRGLVAALNAGISRSQSEFIARMDADDVCLPRRLERQVAYLDRNPTVMMCGTWTRQFGDETIVQRPPAAPQRVRARLFFGWAIDHPSIMVRRSFLERHGLMYRDEFRHVEDLDSFCRASALGDIANLPEVLLRTRAHSEETSVIHRQEQAHTEARLRVGQLRLLMPDATGEEEDFHVAVLDCAVDASRLRRAEQWLLRLEHANHVRPLYDAAAFRRELRLQWYRVHAAKDRLTLGEVLAFCRSPLVSGYSARAVDGAGLLVRAAHRFARRAGQRAPRWLRKRRRSISTPGA